MYYFSTAFRIKSIINWIVLDKTGNNYEKIIVNQV